MSLIDAKKPLIRLQNAIVFYQRTGLLTPHLGNATAQTTSRIADINAGRAMDGQPKKDAVATTLRIVGEQSSKVI